MGGWKRKVMGAVLVAVVSVGGCARVDGDDGVMVDVPAVPAVPAVTCPDPDDRRRLGKGDTYRDVFRAHANAVAGWKRCFDAAEINGRPVRYDGKTGEDDD